MARYINADELKRKFKHFCEGNCKRCGHSTFLADDEQCGLIDQTPTADVVEVVRCKDCISQRTCFIRDHFEFSGIDNPFCCVGKKVE